MHEIVHESLKGNSVKLVTYVPNNLSEPTMAGRCSRARTGF